jgi:ribosomal 50S subunit-recycling heat shock protein
LIEISDIFKVTEIKKKSQAKALKNIKVNDCIKITFQLSRSRGATVVKIENLRTKESDIKYINRLITLLSDYELLKVQAPEQRFSPTLIRRVKDE